MNLPADVGTAPDIYPHDIDLINRRLVFCNMSEKHYRESPFMDHRMVRPDQVSYEIGLDEAFQKFSDIERSPTNYVFHNAFCCSTLFSRCLNAHPEALVLREPDILLKVSSIVRYSNTRLMPNVDQGLVDSIFDVIVTMLGRRYEHNDSVFIKPTDAVNNIITRLLSHHPENTAALIYSDVRRFLVSIFKYPERAQFIQMRVNELLIDDAKLRGSLRIDPSTLKPSQSAALVWLLHMEHFMRAMDGCGEGNVRLINSEDFMSDQPSTVKDYMDFTSLNYDPETIDAGVDEATGSHSKDSTIEYDAGRREREFEEMSAAYKEAVDEGVDWLRTFGAGDVVDRFV